MVSNAVILESQEDVKISMRGEGDEGVEGRSRFDGEACIERCDEGREESIGGL